VRNPVSRILSNYKMFILSDNATRHSQIEALFGTDRRKIDVGQFLQLAVTHRNHHWEQLVEFLPWNRATGEVLLDQICRTETLKQDWDELKKQLGIVVDLARQNSTAHISAVLELPAETQRELEIQFRDDIRAFGI
jgi:hypothetical protein